MKKFVLFAVTALLVGLLMAPSAFAATYTHGDFASNSKGCADCHITHGANAAYLLVAGPTQTDTCFFCHSESGMSSNYDIENGITMGTDSFERPNFAGGFVYSPDPDADWATAISSRDFSTVLKNNTSVHSVENAWQTSTLQAGQASGKDIPGGTTTGWTSSFRCGSCHDPHAGGAYPSAGAYKNPRLLRMNLLGDTSVDRAVYMKIDYTTERRVQEYGKGFNQWCGGCHDVFNTETGAVADSRSGSVGHSNGTDDKFRHKMGVLLSDTGHLSSSLQNGLPLPTNTTGTAPAASTDRLNCLTCHRAHGSSVNVSVGYQRFKSYDTIYATGQDVIGLDDGASALLRLPERDVCYDCHLEATKNLYNGTDKYATGY